MCLDSGPCKRHTVISASDLYGGTYAQFVHTFTKMGLKMKFIDGSDPANLEKAFEEVGEDNVKCVYYETLGNPSFKIPDFEAISKICKAKQTPLMVLYGSLGPELPFLRVL